MVIFTGGLVEVSGGLVELQRQMQIFPGGMIIFIWRMVVELNPLRG